MKASALSDHKFAAFQVMPEADAFLTPLSDVDRARHYPYAAPDGGYVLAHGALYRLEQTQIDRHTWLFEGRVPVLSVGSNRAPFQLHRKFGGAAIVPVTPARLFDCDIVHAAMLGYYAAVPCTAYPCEGCVVSLNVAWLDAAQLLQMHRTEGIGVAYDYVEMQNVQHDVVVPEKPVFGYAARSGVLDCGDGRPAALPVIKATGRQFQTLDQAAAAALVRRLTGYDDNRSHAEFIADIQQQRAAREAVIASLQRHALFHDAPSWNIVPVSVDGLDAYL